MSGAPWTASRKPLAMLPGKEEGAGVSDDELRFIVDINLTEALLCTRAVGPHMLARGSGKVINIASWTARQGGADMVIYTSAKAGLAGFTRAQALEWAPYGVHVNAIAPGIFPDPATGGEIDAGTVPTASSPLRPDELSRRCWRTATPVAD